MTKNPLGEKYMCPICGKPMTNSYVAIYKYDGGQETTITGVCDEKLVTVSIREAFT